jgi:predicted dinucleotide-binding enzyme
MQIGFIGVGQIGTAVAGQLAKAGHELAIANSRGPQTLAAKVAEIGGNTQAMTAEEAVAGSEVVFVAIPFANRAVLRELPFAGKTVVDLMNYYPARDGRIPELDSHTATTSEITSSIIPEAHIVKAFNSIYAGDVSAKARPAGAPDRSALPYAGDDAQAKQTVAELISDTGYDPYDVGALHEGIRFENGTPAYCFRGSAKELAAKLAQFGE